MDIANITFLFFGCMLGTFTGMVPGIHPNTLIPFTILFYSYLSPGSYLYLLIGMVITHYFVNYIPSAFIGVPQDETAVSVLPLHRLTFNGRGYEGVVLCGIGGFIGVLFSVVLSLLIFYIGLDLGGIYNQFKPYIPYVLILLMILSLIFTDNKLWNGVVFLLSGIFGIVVLYNNPPVKNILTAIFTGMFGVPFLLENIKSEKVPLQRITYPELDLSLIKCAFVGTLGGFLRIFLPAIGGAQINFFLSKLIKENNIRNFLVSQGAITMSNEVFSILSLLMIGYGRSGTAVAIKDLSIPLDTSIVIPLIIATGCALYILITLSQYILEYLPRINYGRISLYILFLCLFIVLALGYLSGYIVYYFMVFLISSTLGMLALKSKANMSYLMGVLVFPTILYYL